MIKTPDSASACNPTLLFPLSIYTPPKEKAHQSNIIIIILEVNIPRPPLIIRHKITIPRRPLVTRIRRQHALDTHAHTLHRLHGRPSRRAQQVQAYYPVAVDVWVDGDWAGCFVRGGEGDELDFGGFCTSIFINIWTALAWLLYVYSREKGKGRVERYR